METIEIQAVADVVTSKGGREYFTFEDNTQKRYVCFIPKLNHFIQVGSSIEADITPGKTPQDSPRLDMIYVNGKPVVAVEKKRSGYAPRGRDEDRTDHRSALITIKDLWLGGKLKDDNPLVTWLLAELLVIATGKKEAKSETTKDNKGDKETQTELTDRQDSRETTESDAERVEGFLKYLKEHGKKDPRLWLDVEYGIPQDTTLTLAKCEILYKTIKTKEKW